MSADIRKMEEDSANQESSHNNTEKSDAEMKAQILKLFDGDPLPEYLQVKLVDDGVTLLLDLGVDSVEAVRRMEQVCALNYKHLEISKLELDGPNQLNWETYTETIMRLLVVQNIPHVAVPERHVNGVKGRLSGLILNTLRSHKGVDPLTLAGRDIPLRSVIDTTMLTSRVTSLTYSPIDEETKRVEKLLKSYHNSRQVPKALQSLICKVHKVAKTSYRQERKRMRAAQRAAHGGDAAAAIADSQISSSISCCSPYSDLSGSDQSTGFEVTQDHSEISDNPVSMSEDIPCTDIKGHEKNNGDSKSDKAVKPEAGPSSKYSTSPSDKPTPGGPRCYVCSNRWHPPKYPTDAVNHYPCLCPPCAEVNWSKRNHAVDLQGYVAVVTGGRIKIGYEIVLKLLRNGCQVVTTTRFPHDAAQRFASEPDYNNWSPKLQIYPLELKDAKAIYKFVEYLKENVPFVDILISNAAQTIRRPLSFYEHLMKHERKLHTELPEPQRNLLVMQQSVDYQNLAMASMVATMNPTDSPHSIASIKYDMADRKRPQSEGSSSEGATDSKKPRLDLPGPENTADGWSEAVIKKSEDSYFPVGCVDEFGQQVDLRPSNSWRSVLEEVPISELLEVMMVNTIAPYILNKELKGLMVRSPHKRRFIVNISAMEGQFRRSTKTRFHPHTNMAKAALNMMTRTGALGYRDDSIYMTSVDTGWVSDQRPFAKATREKEKKGFVLPLDCVDAAARAVDPVFSGIENTREPHYAVYLKNYKPFPW